MKQLPKNSHIAYWRTDYSQGKTYQHGEVVKTKFCSHCGHACLFNILGDPIYSKFCPDCGYRMIRRRH